ncbi:MAG: eukaryotic-like serine/threonine-protein kinase [Gammaproteobacteria bacterium]|nr:eukaryotic-like serine/threonine-protein kinase [Gammaproteobacteria bacterium]
MPISAFALALRAFQSGDLTQDELSWEIDRQLAIEKASPVALLEILKVQQVAEPLDVEAHEAILNHLEQWPRDPTIVTGLNCEQPAARTPRAGVGDILQARFSLVALIGEGGMSRVFKAIDLRRVEAGASDPYVAVKVLTEPFSEYFGSIVALQREAHKLQSLSHPNIVRVIDCDRDGHTVFMTMEYLSGESLQKRLRMRPAPALDAETATAVITAVGNALEYAHRNHIVHGDLKPGNILITEQGTIKVIDFGMARFIARPGDGTQAEPAVEVTPKAVTPRYASPELVSGHDPETEDDVYALACIAYEALSGRHPFGLKNDGPRALPPQPAGMPRHQYTALIKALAFDRKRRTASIREFLDQFLGMRRSALAKPWVWAVPIAIVATLLLGLQLIASRRHADVPRASGEAAFASGTVIQDCPVCPTMRILAGGSFMQGAAAGAADVSRFEQPQHAVVIAHAFALSVNEVTMANFADFLAATHRDMGGCNVYDGSWQFQEDASWQAPGFTQGATHPVTCVSWDDAVAYATWLSEKSGHVYRLPSASEWEYAARAGGGPAPWGDDPAAACINANVADASAVQRYPGWSTFSCNDHIVNTAPVGSFRANAFGINDLFGNVMEWVQDCWHDDYSGAPADGTAWQSGPCTERELRGGSWFTSPQYVRASYRNRFESAYRSSTTGLRLVREIGP